MGKRFWEDDRGQTSVEYLGIIAVVVAIVLVLTTTDFGTVIAKAIMDQIQKSPSDPRSAAVRGPPGRRDAGQAFPLYIVAVAGFLFVALAVFAVGMAGAARNGTGSAADAAALAAAQDYREQSYTGFLRDLTTRPGGDWRRWFDGRGDTPVTACREAERLARDNAAGLTGPGCAPAPGPDPTTLAFDVTVTARDGIGTSVVPGSEDVRPTVSSRAVVAPRCRPAPGGDVGAAYARLDCDDGPLTVDPAHPDPRLTARTLFAVRLAATDR